MSATTDFVMLNQFVHTLISSGVKHVCFAPGSRSTPLVLAFAQHREVRLWQHIDERSAGFFGLGIAKSSRSPVALLCTSGTAAANFYPAIIEARLSRVPLIILTADRPHEARDNASPQTIDQIHLYGSHVKWFAEMPIPRGESTMIRHAHQQAARAVTVATEHPAGPIHLNFPLREPLVRDELFQSPFGDDLGQTSTQSGVPTRSTNVFLGHPVLAPQHIQMLIEELKEVQRGLLICGPQEDVALPVALTELAATLHFPILADPLSGLRTGGHDSSNIIDSYDSLLRSDAFVQAHQPEVIIRFGGTPASKSLVEFIASHRGPHWLIDPHDWRDPYLSATHMVRADPAAVCQALSAAWPSSNPTATAGPTPTWTDRWVTANRACRSSIDGLVKDDSTRFEGRIFTELRECLRPGATLFVGNSMPIRDLDTFFGFTERPIHIMGNRGVNGIDGVLSTALGVGAASDDDQVVLVIGDLSFIHDMNALLAAKQYDLNLTVILVHNDGGGIFSFLPQAQLTDHFEALFGTPHGLSFKPLIDMFGGEWSSAEDWDDFRRLLRKSMQKKGLHVIEVRTERRENVRRHRHIWRAAEQAVSVAIKDFPR